MDIFADEYGTYSPYWETDEFEDLVTRALIGLYETKIKAEKHGPKSARFNEEIFKQMRKRGCYFPSNDRIFSVNYEENSPDSMVGAIQSIDLLNDGLPEYAIWSSAPSYLRSDEYLWTCYLERVKFLPKPFVKPRSGVVYRIMQLYFGDKVTGCGTFVVIDNEGHVESCYVPHQYINSITGRVVNFDMRPRYLEEIPAKARDFYAAYASIGIQVFQDRRHLWNVQAKDGTAKATFAVHQEQIKSLFYSRELPMTETGRKKPILHWVKAHQRRMKEGTEYDVNEYLRGTHEFVYNNTKFEIINPLKGH